MTAYFYAGMNEGGEAAPQGVAALRVSCVQRGPTDPRKLERAKGFEPSTPTLARSCSTPELHLHPLGTAARNARTAKGVPIAKSRRTLQPRRKNVTKRA